MSMTRRGFAFAASAILLLALGVTLYHRTPEPRETQSSIPRAVANQEDDLPEENASVGSNEAVIRQTVGETEVEDSLVEMTSIVPDLMTDEEERKLLQTIDNHEDWDGFMVQRTFDGLFDTLREGHDLDRMAELTSRRLNPRGVALTAAELNELQDRLEPVNEEIRMARIAYEIERYQAFLQAAESTGPTQIPSAGSYSAADVLNGKADPTAFSRVRHDFIEELQAQAGGRDNFDFIVASAFWEGHRPESANAWAAMADTRGNVPVSRENVFTIRRSEYPGPFLAKDHLADRKSLRLEMARAFIESLGR